MDLLNGAPFTFLLLAANVLISLIALTDRKFFMANIQTTRDVRAGEWHRLLTSGFVHVGPLHLFVNMLALYIFAPYLEVVFGARTLLIIYFASLIGGSLLAVVMNWNKPNYAGAGASGAISGVVIAFCIFEPTRTLYLLGLVPIPALVFGVGYILISALLMKRENRIIGHDAHLGGALAGAVATLVFVPGAVQALFGAFG